jgi:hypothetical protein
LEHEQAVLLNQDHGWSGGNTKAARSAAARALDDFVKNYTFKPGEQLNIVAHSHGGNVAFEASQSISHTIDNLVTLGTPIRGDYEPNMKNIANLVNVYSYNDGVQTSGSGISIFSALRTLPEQDGVKNVEAPEATGHSDLWQNPNVWQQQVVPNLNLPNNSTSAGPTTHSMEAELEDTVQRVEN